MHFQLDRELVEIQLIAETQMGAASGEDRSDQINPPEGSVCKIKSRDPRQSHFCIKNDRIMVSTVQMGLHQGGKIKKGDNVCMHRISGGICLNHLEIWIIGPEIQ